MRVTGSFPEQGWQVKHIEILRITFTDPRLTRHACSQCKIISYPLSNETGGTGK